MCVLGCSHFQVGFVDAGGHRKMGATSSKVMRGAISMLMDTMRCAVVQEVDDVVDAEVVVGLWFTTQSIPKLTKQKPQRAILNQFGCYRAASGCQRWWK